MKNPINNKNKYLIIGIFILYFTVAFQEAYIIFNEQESRDDRNTYLAVSNSFVMGWNRTWGGTLHDFTHGVAVDSSGNIYLAGATYSFGVGSSDMVLVKYDENSVQQWNRTWGGSNRDGADGVAVDSSNNMYLAGNTEDDMALVKYDSSGIQQWNRTWGVDDHEAIGVAVDSSDNVYLAGNTVNFDADMFLIKYDGSGIQQWNRTWDDNLESCYGVVVDSLNNVYIAGITGFDIETIDMVLVKYDSSGVQQWNRTWGGSDYDVGLAVAVDSSYNVYVTGGTGVYGEAEETFKMVLIQYNSSGVLQWDQTLGWDASNAITLDSSDIPILAGTTTSYSAGLDDLFIVKFVPDIYKPIITINNPVPDEKFYEKAPNYNLSIVEPNLESMWYTIDDGLSNHSFTELSGTIKQSVWDVASKGNITIEFWAKNLEGYMGHSEVVVEKVWEKIDSFIPGYNLLLLICAISIITVISFNKKQK